MARKTVTIEIDANNRDIGKAFLLTEMSANDAERWAIRAGFALMNSGADFSELTGTDEDGEPLPLSFQAFAKMGLSALSKIPYESAEQLIAEMMKCVKFIPDKNKPNVVRDIFDGDIEEVSTLFTLKKEVWGLHVNFSQLAEQ